MNLQNALSTNIVQVFWANGAQQCISAHEVHWSHHIYCHALVANLTEWGMDFKSFYFRGRERERQRELSLLKVLSLNATMVSVRGESESQALTAGIPCGCQGLRYWSHHLTGGTLSISWNWKQSCVLMLGALIWDEDIPTSALTPRPKPCTLEQLFENYITSTS